MKQEQHNNNRFKQYLNNNEPSHEKTCFFAYAKTMAQFSCSVTVNVKFQAPNNLLWLYSTVVSLMTGFLTTALIRSEQTLEILELLILCNFIVQSGISSDTMVLDVFDFDQKLHINP